LDRKASLMSPHEHSLLRDLISAQKQLTQHIALLVAAMDRTCNLMAVNADAQAGLAEEIGSLVGAISQDDGDDGEGRGSGSLDD
jgi:hypothetical protein